MKFKAGDLVMAVRKTPCCGMGDVGFIFKVCKTSSGIVGQCFQCKTISISTDICSEDGNWYSEDRFIKIDPPATGETRKAYKNLKVTV